MPTLPFVPRRSLAPSLLVAILAIAASTSDAQAFGDGGLVPNYGQFDDQVRFGARGNGVDVYLTDGAVVLDVWDQANAVRLPLPWRGTDHLSVEPLERLETRLNYFLGDDPSRWAADVPVYAEVVVRDAQSGNELWLRPEADALLYRWVAPASGSMGANGGEPRDMGFRLTARCEGAVVSKLGERDISMRVGERTLRDVPSFAHAGGAYDRAIVWGEQPSKTRGGDLGPGAEERDSAGLRRADNPSSVVYSTYIGGSDHDRAHALLVDDAGSPILGGYTRSNNFPATAGSYDPTSNGGYDAHVCKFNSDGTVLLWATFVGGGLEDRVFAIHEAGNGDLVISGHTYSTNFPTTTNAFDRTLGGTRDAYAAKLNGTGSALLWSTYLGGSLDDRSWDMNLDSLGRPVLSGDTFSSDFPTTPGVFQPTFPGAASWSDGFVTKLKADGTGLVWSTFLGGTFVDYVKFMAMGTDDSPFLCGATTSSNFPSTPGSFDPSHNGGNDVFVVKMTPDGSGITYGTFLGGTGSDLGEVIVADVSGDVVLTGSTTSTDFPTTSGAYDTSYNGVKDAFVTRLDAAGETLVYSTYVGGSGDDEPWSLVVDPDGAPIFSGYVQSVDFPTTVAAFDQSHNGLQDANITQLDPTGSSLLYSSYFGGSDLDGGWELALHPTGNPVLTGPTGSPDFPTTPGAYDTTHNGGRDVFLTLFLIRDPSSTPGTPPFQGDAALRAWPNPFARSVEVRLSVPRAGRAEAQVVDVSGRQVARLFDGRLSAGDHVLHWDGRDVDGRAMASGMYWVRVLLEDDLAHAHGTTTRSMEQRVVLVR